MPSIEDEYLQQLREQTATFMEANPELREACQSIISKKQARLDASKIKTGKDISDKFNLNIDNMFWNLSNLAVSQNISWQEAIAQTDGYDDDMIAMYERVADGEKFAVVQAETHPNAVWSRPLPGGGYEEMGKMSEFDWSGNEPVRRL